MECGAFSVVEDAFERSSIDVTKVTGIINPLGMEDSDWFTYNVLVCAGITVELLEKTNTDEDLYSMVQISDDAERDRILGVRDLDEISYGPAEAWHGMQVKLSGAHKWKLTVADALVEQREPHAVGRAPRRAGGAVKVSTIENRHVYEIAVPVPGDGMLCCAAVVCGITITIAFKTHKQGGMKKSYWNDQTSLPYIEQRRIDGIFTNPFVTAVQVRVPVFQCSSGTESTCPEHWNRTCVFGCGLCALRVYGSTRETCFRTRGVALHTRRIGKLRSVSITGRRSWSPTVCARPHRHRSTLPPCCLRKAIGIVDHALLCDGEIAFR